MQHTLRWLLLGAILLGLSWAILTLLPPRASGEDALVQIQRDRASATATAVAVVAAQVRDQTAREWAPFTWVFALALVGCLVLVGGYALLNDLGMIGALRQRGLTLIYPREGYLPVSYTSIQTDPRFAYQQDRVHSRANGTRHLTEITHNHDQRKLPPLGWGGLAPAGGIIDGQPAAAALPAAEPIRLVDLFDARAFFGESLLVAFHRATRGPIRMRWDQFIAPIFAGKPRNGKSSGLAFSVLSFILYLANLGLGCKILAFDPHYGAADSLSARLAGLSEYFLCQPGRTWQDLEKFCTWIAGELERRKVLPPDRWGGGLIFIVDEMSSIFVRLPSDPDKAEWERIAALFADTMYTLNTQGPKYLMTVWGATHEVGAQALSAKGNDAKLRRAVSTWVVYNLDQAAAKQHLDFDTETARKIATQHPGEATLMNHLSGLPITEVSYPQVPSEALHLGVQIAGETIRERQRSGPISVQAAMPWKQETTNTLDSVVWPNVLDTMIADEEWSATLDKLDAVRGAGAEAVEVRKVREAVQGTPPPLTQETGQLPGRGEGPEAVEAPAFVPPAAYGPSGDRILWTEWMDLIALLESREIDGKELPEDRQEYLAFIMLKMLPKPLTMTAVLKTLWQIEGGKDWSFWTGKIRAWQSTWEATGPPVAPTKVASSA